MSFIEESNRVSIIGIISIVLIVFAVTIYFRASPSVTDSHINIANNLQGSATEGFQGIKTIYLTSEDDYVSFLSTKSYSRKYVVYDDVLDLFDDNNKLQEIHLNKLSEGIYSGFFIDQGKKVNVIVNYILNKLLLKGVLSNNKTIIKLPLVLEHKYSGRIKVLDDVIVAVYVGNNLKLYSNEGIDNILLKDNDGLLAGLWIWHGKEHVVLLDTAKKTIRLYDMY